jgi:IS1 family transposase
MNQLPLPKRTQVAHMLVEGASMRSIERITGVHIDTIMRLLRDMGRACSVCHDTIVRNIHAKYIQCDEIHSFCYAKQKNVPEDKLFENGIGTIWIWKAIDAETKLIIHWHVGRRTKKDAMAFIDGLKQHIIERFQLTTDGFIPYISAVENVFGGDIDYGMLVKNYDNRSHYAGADKRIISGHPQGKHISTSYIERENLTLRMHNKRFARKTNAFSKKIENHKHSLALFYMYYNFCCIHSALRVTPAMEAGLTNHIWGIEDLLNLVPPLIAKKRGPYRAKKIKNSN